MNTLLLRIPVLLCLFTGAAGLARAQSAVPPPMAAYQSLPAAQLDQLLGPIALYPDPLIAEILPAATLPTQVVLANRFIIGGGDPNQLGQQPWDASVQAVARYPNVLKFMDDNLNWTAQVGQAFLNQQPEVMNSIQRLRGTAAKLGNLPSTPQQQVITDGSSIEIVPADPQVIYVPVYQPSEVYFDAYYGSPYITFGVGYPFGIWMGYDCDWAGGNLIFWGNGHRRPDNWWRQSSRQRDMSHAGIWRADNHPGAVAANRGDRGYGNALARGASPAAIRQALAHPAARPAERSANSSRAAPAAVGHVAPATVGHVAPTAVGRAEPTAVGHAAPARRSEPTGALIGIQSSQATKAYSNRGQQSIQAPPRSAPVSHSAPAGGGSSGGHGGGGGGGGGGHGGGGRR